MRGESVHRLVLGVGLAPAEVARQLRASVGLAEQPGLLVRTVEPGSPAAAAGLKVGDLLTQAAGGSPSPRSTTSTPPSTRPARAAG